MPQKHATIDEYLATIPETHRAALEKLRKTIQSAAPRAEECISYGVPAFRLDGLLVCFAAARNHCSFFPCSGRAIEAFEDELRDFDKSKGTIRFKPEKPIPAGLIRKMVKFRATQNAAKAKR